MKASCLNNVQFPDPSLFFFNTFSFNNEEDESNNSYSFESCWLNFKFSFELGDCASTFQENVASTVSSTKNVVEKFVDSLSTFETSFFSYFDIEDITDNGNEGKLSNEENEINSHNQSMIEDESHSFSSLMYKTFIDPVKASKDALFKTAKDFKMD